MRKNLTFVLFILSQFFFAFLLSANTAHALTDTNIQCNGDMVGVNLSYDFAPPLVNDKTSITVTISHGGNLPDGNYSLKVSDNTDIQQRGVRGKYYDIVIENGSDLIFNNVTTLHDKFEAGRGKVTLQDLQISGSSQTRNAICSDGFEVVTPEDPDNPGGSSCEIQFKTDFNPNSGITFRVDGLTGADDKKRGMVLTKTDDTGKPLDNDVDNECESKINMSSEGGVGFFKDSTGQNRWPSGYYTVKVTADCEAYGDAKGDNICDSPILIKVDPEDGRVIGPVKDGANTSPNVPLSLPCPTGAGTYSAAQGCTKIQTAVGVVGTGAPAFTRWVLGFILSISGGIVLLIIIISGYRLMTSQGDPEKIKNARDQLTAAIVGLLFIIFSLVILQLITSDVLGLPGFGN